MDSHAATADAMTVRCEERPVALDYAQSAKQMQARLGAAIRGRRQLLGLSLTELAQACGVSFQQVQKYELGVSRISAAQLWKISAPLAVPVEYFYQGLKAADAG